MTSFSLKNSPSSPNSCKNGAEKKRKAFVRPIAVAGLTFTVTLAAANALSVTAAVCLAIAFLVLALLISCIGPLRSPKVALITIVIGLAFGCFSVYTHFNYTPVLKLADKTRSISGVVVDKSTTSAGRSFLTVRLDTEVTDTVLPAKMNLYFKEPPKDIRVADRIQTNVRIFLPSERYGTYSSISTGKADGIFLMGYHSGADIRVTTDDGFHLSRALYDLRITIGQNIMKLMPAKEAGILQAMLLSDKSEIGDDTYRDFVRTGSIHILVVSGLHLLILSQFVIRLLRLCRVNRKVTYGIGSFVVLFFMAVASFQPAVNRAGFTLILLYIGRLFSRETDPLTSLGLSALVFSLLAPYTVLDISFQLTYLSTLGVLLFTEKMTAKAVAVLRIRNSFLRWCTEMICLTLSVMIAALPVTIYYFKGLPLLSPIFNLLISPIVYIILPLGLILAVIAALPFLGIPAQMIASVLTVLIKATEGLTQLCSAIPFSYLPLNQRFVYLWIILTIILFGFVYVKCSFRYKYTLTAILSAVTLLVSVGTYAAVHYNTVAVSVCTIGEESSVLVKCRGRIFAFGCNGLVPSLADQAGQRDFAFVLENDDPVSLQLLGKRADIDLVYTDLPLLPGAIECERTMPVTPGKILSGTPMKLEVRKDGENIICVAEFGVVNIVYGKYSKAFEDCWKPGKENVYILVNDCNSVFQKPVNYAIILDNAAARLSEQNPSVKLIDGSKEGITTLFFGQNGACREKGADSWLY